MRKNSIKNIRINEEVMRELSNIIRGCLLYTSRIITTALIEYQTAIYIVMLNIGLR